MHAPSRQSQAEQAAPKGKPCHGIVGVAPTRVETSHSLGRIQECPCHNGVACMLLDSVQGVQHCTDAPLGIGGAALHSLVFGDDGHSAIL